eukprot:CAMPEP_0170546048 /NCGR_PEP_ID=MMETSP0211-20121228/4418_1 /TAXON_ID=311385 /ORGANISM="Pseudokeronopsis sp., Strain OXSARD2" /LENGTH=58 /DNA_ID=CAMNT_0010850295 /DNA_START=684 /DNA_END=860 /DNA_ORIENTATION=+
MGDLKQQYLLQKALIKEQISVSKGLGLDQQLDKNCSPFELQEEFDEKADSNGNLFGLG